MGWLKLSSGLGSRNVDHFAEWCVIIYNGKCQRLNVLVDGKNIWYTRTIIGTNVPSNWPLFYRRISINMISENAYSRRANGNPLTTLLNTYTLIQFFDTDKFQPIPNKLELFTLQLCIIFCCRRSSELTYGELLLLLLLVFCTIFFSLRWWW